MAVGVGAGELRELNDEDLTTKLRQAKEELFNLRFQSATGQLSSNHRLRIGRGVEDVEVADGVASAAQ